MLTILRGLLYRFVLRLGVLLAPGLVIGDLEDTLNRLVLRLGVLLAPGLVVGDLEDTLNRLVLRLGVFLAPLLLLLYLVRPLLTVTDPRDMVFVLVVICGELHRIS